MKEGSEKCLHTVWFLLCKIPENASSFVVTGSWAVVSDVDEGLCSGGRSFLRACEDVDVSEWCACSLLNCSGG